jgi:hypothetical protein
MELGRCPICHHRISLEAIAKDQAGRELAALVAKTDSATGQALLSYLGLFRSPTRDLANDRALVLAREVLALESPQWLAPALIETVEAIHNKRSQGGAPKPLKNHNYLKQVLESVIAQNIVAANLETHQTTTEPDYRSAAAAQKRLTDTSW